MCITRVSECAGACVRMYLQARRMNLCVHASGCASMCARRREILCNMSGSSFQLLTLLASPRARQSYLKTSRNGSRVVNGCLNTAANSMGTFLTRKSRNDGRQSKSMNWHLLLLLTPIRSPSHHSYHSMITHTNSAHKSCTDTSAYRPYTPMYLSLSPSISLAA